MQPATLRLVVFTTVLLADVLCLCPHILSFLMHAGCSLLNLETGERGVVTETLGHAVKKQDAESQLVSVGAQGSIEVDRDGYLYLFANDAAWAYDNNSGAITAIIERRR